MKIDGAAFENHGTFKERGNDAGRHLVLYLTVNRIEIRSLQTDEQFNEILLLRNRLIRRCFHKKKFLFFFLAIQCERKSQTERASVKYGCEMVMQHLLKTVKSANASK